MSLFGSSEDDDLPKPLHKRMPQSLPSRRHGHRSYCCPECEGEFDVWDTAIVNGGYEDRCPFCGLVRGQYDPEDGGDD